MLNAQQQKSLDDLWAQLKPEGRAWLVGYVNGRAKEAGVDDAPAVNALTLHIYYATETGNTKHVATQLEKAAKASGFKTKTAPFTKIKPSDITAIKDPVVFLSSTHGEGDPPDMGKNFFKALKEADALKTPDLHYAVLGLGDRAYKEFCACGIVLDNSFAQAGGKRFYDTALFDVDYNAHINAWVTDIISALKPLAPQGTVRVAASVKADEPVPSKGFSRLESIKGRIKEIVNLNDRGSAKETFHIEITFDDALPYQPGDSAGIILAAGADGAVPTPRLYSIASSPARSAQELHLTVAHARYTRPDGTTGYGLCSHYLATRKEGDVLDFYIQRNNRFRLPEDNNRPIIMIGPGTGIAPFRAFVQERAERGAAGHNWLFYGDQHAHCDFLYQAEWLEYLENGTLTRMDVAFSRDQKEKIYVQHRLQQHAKDIYAWLEEGATLYVCGAKNPMSADVEKALLTVISTQSGKDANTAQSYLDQLAEDDRYLKDVY